MGATEGEAVDHGGETGSGSRRLALAAAALTTLAVGSVILAAELALEFGSRDPLARVIEKRMRDGLEVDLRSRAEVLRAVRERGSRAVPFPLPLALLERDASDPETGELTPALEIGGVPTLPLAGVSRRKTVFCNEYGPWIVYESDAHGFRNPPGTWDGPADVVLVGDSYAAGACVPDGDTIASRLGRRFERVANLGVSGIGPLAQLGILREYGSALRPPVVAWLFFENDLMAQDLGVEVRVPLLRRYLEPEFDQGLMARQAEVDRALDRHFDAVLARSSPASSSARRALDGAADVRGRLLRVAQLRSLRSRLGRLRERRSGAEPGTPVDVATLRAVLARARDDAAGWGGQLVFATLPAIWSLDRPSPLSRAARDVAVELGIPVADAGPWIRGASDPEALFAYPGNSRFAGPPHYSVAGYARVAEGLAEFLDDVAPTGRRDRQATGHPAAP